MQCKGCERELSAEQVRPVGSWAFCDACLQQLLTSHAANAQPPEALSEGVEADSEAKATATATSCLVCSTSLHHQPCVRLGPKVVLCESCHASFVAEPMSRIREAEHEEARARAQAKSTVNQEPQEVRPVGVMGNKTCALCGRGLIEPGGYHTLDDKHLCPGCFHRTDLGAQEAKPDDRAASLAATSGAPKTDACEACGRAMVSNTIAGYEGFYLCEACLSTDKESALFVARKRHHARIQRLRQELEEESS